MRRQVVECDVCGIEVPQRELDIRLVQKSMEASNGIRVKHDIYLARNDEDECPDLCDECYLKTVKESAAEMVKFVGHKLDERHGGPNK